MWPDQPYAEARGSFLRPVPMPTVDPNASPTKTVSVSCQYLPYIRGALQQLLLQSTWKEGTGDLLLTQERVFNLIDLFTECSSSDLPFFCSGDARSSASPFAVWTLDTPPYSGVWVSGAGYQATCGVGSDGNSYCGIRLKVQLDQAVDISDVQLLYDYNEGSFDGPLNVVGVYDLTNSAVVGTWLTNSTVVSGSGLTYHSGPFSAPSSQFFIFIHTCVKIGASGSCDVDGLAFLLGINVAGSSATYDCG